MSNILIDILPNTVEINEEVYEINSDFRTSILFEMLIQDDDFTSEEKIYQALLLYYPIVPSNVNEAMDRILWFYRCGKDEKKSKDVGDSEKRVTRIYDFEIDSEYIYASFLSQYNIDLQDIDDLHWWKFKAMFNSLGSDNKIVEIMGYRSIKLSTIKDEEQRKFYKKMQRLYELPVNRDELQKTNDLEEALKNGDVDKLNCLLDK